MEKQEAINKLEQTVGAYLLSGQADDTTCGEWREILETLKRDDAYEDAITRKAVLELINNYGISMSGNKAYEDVCNGLVRATKIALCDAIKNVPSVTPTRRQGKWIRRGHTLKCPLCGAKGVNIKDDYYFNFCPCCGARMEDPE